MNLQDELHAFPWRAEAGDKCDVRAAVLPDFSEPDDGCAHYRLGDALWVEAELGMHQVFAPIEEALPIIRELFKRREEGLPV